MRLLGLLIKGTILISLVYATLSLLLLDWSQRLLSEDWSPNEC